MVVVARMLLSRSYQITCATSEVRPALDPPSFVNPWLLGGIVGLLTVAISLRAIGILHFRNIPFHEAYHGMARWVLERPLERLPLIFVPGHEWGGIRAGYFRTVAGLTCLVDLISGGAPPREFCSSTSYSIRFWLAWWGFWLGDSDLGLTSSVGLRTGVRCLSTSVGSGA